MDHSPWTLEERVLITLPHVARKTPDEHQEAQPATGKVLHEQSLSPEVAAYLGERLRTYYAWP